MKNARLAATLFFCLLARLSALQPRTMSLSVRGLSEPVQRVILSKPIAT